MTRNVLWRVFWVAWWCVAIGADIIGVDGKANFWWWMFLVFLPMEAWGITQSGRKDTLSEHVWLFTRGGIARGIGGAGLGVWLSWHFYMLTPGGVGPAILACSLAGWLVPHFALVGEHG